MNLEDYEETEIDYKDLLSEDRWILSRLNDLTAEIKVNMDNYDLGVAIDKIYSFIWNEFCDWYIEIVKTRLYNKEDKSRRTAQFVLNKVLGDSLKLLHPFMPFVTEEIYSKLFNEDESIMIAKYPEYSKDLEFKDDEKNIEQIKEVIVGIRNIRTKMNVHPSKKSKLIFIAPGYEEFLESADGFIKKLGFSEDIEIRNERIDIPKNAVNVVTSSMEVFIPFEDLVDIKEEIERLEKEKQKVLIEKEKTDKMLSNPGFIEKAPQAKVEEERQKLIKFNEMIDSIEQRINSLGK
jgi:valyl-tRNA synthetase